MDHGGDAEARGARELLVRLIETFPGSGDIVIAHEHLGELDAREGHRSAAEAHFRAAMRLGGLNEPARLTFMSAQCG